MDEALAIDPEAIDAEVMEKVNEVCDNRALRPSDGLVVGKVFIEELWQNATYEEQAEQQYPGLNTDPETWGYTGRTGPPWSGPEGTETRGHGLVIGEEPFKDTSSEAYKDELVHLLEAKRLTDYANLPDWVFNEFKAHVRRRSKAYQVQGARPTVLKGYVVEWEVDPTSTQKPVVQQPMKRSPPMEAIERHHLKRKMSTGFLSILPHHARTRWASRSWANSPLRPYPL